QIAGISGIIGRPEQPNRMTQDDFLAALKQLLLRHPEFILLHEGPDYPPKNLDGNSEIRSVIEKSPANLIFCGHRHWPTPLINLKNGTQIVNVDKRVVILLKDSTFAA
ncbi:MAG: metallophosphoesterase, partial [Saprospiraceae bacterium]|nr:metallophosphoesterase [Saprospiraceae bacterium]